MARRLMLMTTLLMFLVGVAHVSAQGPDLAPDRHFVGFRAPVTPGDLAFLRGQGVRLGRNFDSIRAIEIVTRSAVALAAIQNNARVEYVEAMPMRYKAGLGDQQLTPNLGNGLYGLITTKSVDVHSLGFTGAGVKVGVADTALDCTHIDIAANLVDVFDAVGDGSHGGCWQSGDVNEEHATHVAGTILGVFNSAGVYGVAYNADLYHARVLGPQGGTSAEVMAGVDHLVNEFDVQIVNMSLGGGFPSIAEFRFYNQIRNQGVLVIAATGNNGRNRVSFPAAYAPNVAVGAVDVNNAIADFSNQGRNIDIVGPGVNVLSSVPDGKGSEAAVTSGPVSASAIGFEFAGLTQVAGVTGTLVNCGQALAASDCPPSVSGNIALIQRGVNGFDEKVANAMTAGAAAAIIYNNVAGNFAGTLGTPDNNGVPWIPAVSVSDTDGAALLGRAGMSATVVNIESDWALFSGTSMATPHVAGVAALVWSASPSMTNLDVEEALLTTATDLGTAGYDTTFGHGLVNALAAVQSVVPASRRSR